MNARARRASPSPLGTSIDTGSIVHCDCGSRHADVIVDELSLDCLDFRNRVARSERNEQVGTIRLANRAQTLGRARVDSRSIGLSRRTREA